MTKQIGYDKGDEKFGYPMAILYLVFTRMGSYKEFTRFIVDDIVKSDATSVLDVGTGPASIPIELLKRKKMDVYAVDPSNAMIRIARHRTRSLKGIKLAVGSSRWIPFNRKFDLIISTLSYHHWAKKKESLVYLKKLLSKNGEIRIYEYNKQSLKRLHRAAGGHSVGKDEMLKIAKDASLDVKVFAKGEFICAIFRARP